MITTEPKNEQAEGIDELDQWIRKNNLQANAGKGFVLSDGTEYVPTFDELAALREAYPDVDIAQQLKQVREWCRVNVEKRKTRRGAARFLSMWMARAQNGFGKPPPKPAAPKPMPYEREPEWRWAGFASQDEYVTVISAGPSHPLYNQAALGLNWRDSLERSRR